MDPLRVLVTDDELGMRMGVARALRDFTVQAPDINGDVAFTVEEAGTGEEALERIRQGPPDILLLDYKMPGIGGLEVLDEVVKLNVSTLTIMITAYASIETAVTATKRGAYDFLAKPFTPAELKGTVRKAAVRVILARQARNLEREKRQVRFQFTRVLGHELKAPLNAVEGYLRMIQDGALGNDVAAYRPMVDRSLIRIEGMRKLVADLLDMTHIESGQRTRQLAELDLRDVARSAIETIAPEAAARRIAIALHADGPVSMTADRSEIEMILNNLISNAVKYNRDEGRVDVSLGRANGQVTIRVADTGIGLTAEDAGRLFHEFVRIKNERTADIVGSGLGLSIVKKLATLYGGDTLVAAQPDQGSAFTVVLNDPADQAATE
jgi:two-component system, sensor histidine kinase and response regulator